MSYLEELKSGVHALSDAELARKQAAHAATRHHGLQHREHEAVASIYTREIKRRRRIDTDAEHARRVLGQLGARVVPMS